MIRASILAACFAMPAFAQQQCGELQSILTELADRYGESPRVSALMSGGDVLVITAAPSGGWTALGITAAGEACILAAGEAFEVKAAPIPGTDG